MNISSYNQDILVSTSQDRRRFNNENSQQKLNKWELLHYKLDTQIYFNRKKIQKKTIIDSLISLTLV